ncbi:MAG: crossover junction endodeoxyribonuclease RuvC [Planctomycetota bacterium]
MRVVGVDPGLNITGYGVVDHTDRGVSLVEAGYAASDRADPMPERIRSLHDDLRAVLRETEPDAVAIERLYAHYKHPRTAILMGHARGAILLAAAECGLPVHSYNATMIKRALTGNGHASKRQMQRMIEVALGLSEPPEPPDVADALAVALCHLNAVTRPAEMGRSAT